MEGEFSSVPEISDDWSDFTLLQKCEIKSEENNEYHKMANSVSDFDVFFREKLLDSHDIMNCFREVSRAVCLRKFPS